jgi:hypothetical protein
MRFKGPNRLSRRSLPRATHAKAWSPRGDSNPPTFRLQIGCATVAPLGLDPSGLLGPGTGCRTIIIDPAEAGTSLFSIGMASDRGNETDTI